MRVVFPIGCGVLFAALWLDYRDFWLDDAFITFRYAHNLASGHGPVFNPGEAVEGYSTFAWMLVSALPFALLERDAALVTLKGLGLLLGLGVLWRTWRFPRPDGAPGRVFTVALLAASPVFLANCGDGMETPLFAWLLLECARAALRPGGARAGAVTGALAAALVWTRPDALAFAAALPATLALLDRARRGAWLGGYALAAGVPIAGQLTWRWLTYGALVPNTYYAKATGALVPRLESGLANLGSLLAGRLEVPPLDLWLLVALAVLGSASLLRRGEPAARLWLGVLWLGVAFRLGFDLWSGGEWMGVYRFLAPALPPLVVLADEGRRVLWARPRARAWVAAALAVGVGFGTWGHVAQARARSHYQRGLASAHIALGRWLAERHPPGTWVALGDAGAVPFYSGLPVIDLWGLVDARIARMPGEYGRRPGAVDYALSREPRVIVLWNQVPIAKQPGRLSAVGGQAFDQTLFEHPGLARHYRFVREFTFRPEQPDLPGYYLDVFERRSPGTRPDR